jgi:hypothetical protein
VVVDATTNKTRKEERKDVPPLPKIGSGHGKRVCFAKWPCQMYVYHDEMHWFASFAEKDIQYDELTTYLVSIQ